MAKVKRDYDDCFTAAMATVLQVPIDQVPEPHLSKRIEAGEPPEQIELTAWQETCCWLAARGLRMILHRKVPAARRRWNKP
jgi:hypothetical protein